MDEFNRAVRLTREAMERVTVAKGSDLFKKWIEKYPNAQFTQIMLRNIKEWGAIGGDFATALYEGNLDSAFAHADLINLSRLQKLTGITKGLYGKLNWGWEHEENVDYSAFRICDNRLHRKYDDGTDMCEVCVSIEGELKRQPK
jgi:hypothetical protein